jgi:hypothetical protein
MIFQDISDEIKLILNESDEDVVQLIPGAMLRAVQKLEKLRDFTYMRRVRRFVLGDDKKTYSAPDNTGFVSRTSGVGAINFYGGSQDWRTIGFFVGDKILLDSAAVEANGVLSAAVGITGTVLATTASNFLIDFSTAPFPGGNANISLPAGQGFTTPVGYYDLSAFLMPKDMKSLESVDLFSPDDENVFIKTLDQKEEDDFLEAEISNILEGSGEGEPTGYVLYGETRYFSPVGISQSEPRALLHRMYPVPSERYNVEAIYFAKTTQIVMEEEHWLCDTAFGYLVQESLFQLSQSFRDRDIRTMAADERGSLLAEVVGADHGLTDKNRTESFGYTPYQKRG